MSSIQGNVQELKEINVEIKRLQNETKKLKKRGQELEKFIISYLNEKEQPGLKYQNTAILIENKAKICSVLVCGTVMFSAPGVPNSSSRLISTSLTVVLSLFVILGWFNIII